MSGAIIHLTCPGNRNRVKSWRPLTDDCLGFLFNGIHILLIVSAFLIGFQCAATSLCAQLDANVAKIPGACKHLVKVLCASQIDDRKGVENYNFW